MIEKCVATCCTRFKYVQERALLIEMWGKIDFFKRPSFSFVMFKSPSRVSENQERNANSSFTRSNTAPLQTYEQFQASRAERMNQIQIDIDAKKEQDLHDLQNHLAELTIQVSAVQTELSAVETDYVNQRETLLTQISRIKTDAEVESEELRMNHLSEIEKLQLDHSNKMQDLVKSMSEMAQKTASFKTDENPSLKDTKTKIRQFEGNVRKYKQRSMIQENDFESETANLYSQRISQLEEQKRNLLQEIKEEENNNKSRLMELTLVIDEQETEFQSEILEIQDQMRKKEEQYQQQLERISSQLDRVQRQRQENREVKKQKTDFIQSQIDRVEEEFKFKVSDATRVAEKLKTALVNANIRKSQRLQIDQQRSHEQQKLMHENLQIQQQMFAIQRDLKKARDNSSLLRRELSARIGPRRTASMFM